MARDARRNRRLFATRRAGGSDCACLRLADRHNLCHALLGIPENTAAPCAGCAAHETSDCVRKTSRLRQLAKALVVLRPWRVEKWPYDGPIGVRERSDLHVLDDWRYVGTAHSEHEIHQVMETRPRYFDQDTFAFLAKTLPRLPQKRILRLPRGEPLCAATRQRPHL